MTWANPDLWWLLPLAAVPVLIHLLIRQRLPRTQWAAMTFLMRALRKNRRRLLLETVLLLIVRTALVLAFALVVLRPAVRHGWRWLAGQREQTTCIIVLDVSASMGATDGLRTRLERGISRIDQYLDELPSASEVGVILAGKPLRDLVAHPTRDIAYVRDELARVEASDVGNGLIEAIERGADRLRKAQTPNGEIVIVTDAQVSMWTEDREKIKATLDELEAEYSVVLLALEPTPPVNISVTDLSIAGGPDGLVDRLASNRWPTRITARLVADHYTDPVETAVELLVDGRKVAREQVTCRPDEPAVLTFEHRFAMTGPHGVEVRSDTDLYPADNQRSVVLNVRDRIPVLIVDGRLAGERFKTASGFLRVALWPAGAEGDDAGLFDVEVVSPAETTAADPSAYALIVLADVPALPPGVTGAIQRAVSAGSGLWCIAGEQMTGRALSAMFEAGGHGLLPMTFGSPLQLEVEDDPILLRLVEPLAPALAAFEDPTLASALSTVTWRAAYPVTAVTGDRSQAWAMLSDGSIGVVAGEYDRGRTVYVGVPLNRTGTDFPLSPAYVPFVQQIAFHLALRDHVISVAAGERLTFETSNADVSLIYPDGSRESMGSYASVEPGSGTTRIALPSAGKAGVYSLQTSSDDGVSRRQLRAVNVSDDERAIEMMPAPALADEQTLSRALVIPPAASMRSALQGARQRAELSGMGVIVLLTLLALELTLVRLFSPKPVDTEGLLSRAMRL